MEIYTEEDHSVHEIMLDPSEHKTEHVWHVLVDTLPPSGVLYAYKVQGQGGWETGGRSVASLDSIMWMVHCMRETALLYINWMWNQVGVH